MISTKLFTLGLKEIAEFFQNRTQMLLSIFWIWFSNKIMKELALKS